ncbi:Lipase, GDSL [Gossypium australe]|uniref:Lipase, GDSL n=1 Tax=Gossypium australe TaxID=47621 RepID=A0A5B6WBC5_9ROSI|nr:Lipase, GDSL [Gossypium australe]
MGTIWNKLMTICLVIEIIANHLRVPTICFAHNITAFFVFGDSLVEVGNNNYINTLAKPVFPNGIDFPKGTPSEEELGFKDYAPPFLAPNTNGDMILKGVNYASSGSGILQSSGLIFGGRICMDKQVDYFAKTRQDIISRIGAPAAQALLRNSLYFVMIGSNDIIFGEYSLALDFNHYVDGIVSKFKSQLTTLYNLDARKIVVLSSLKVGCMPFEIDIHFCAQDCVSSLNKLAKLYNSKLKSLLEDLTKNLSGSAFVYADYYAVTEDLINNYRSYGFEKANHACCELIGRHGGLFPCLSMCRICPDRTNPQMGTIRNKLIIICSILSHILAKHICFAHNISAFFVFGDSLVDGGNNYYINTLAKPEYPNGIDFPKETPSGEEIGFEDYAPPFLAPNTTGDMILKGVNYASSGAGILQTTGALFGERISMGKQVDYFAKTRQDIISRIGATAAQALLRNSLYFLGIGANDILFGEFRTAFGTNEYVDEIISNFKSQLTRLYNLDARKIAVLNAPKVGLIPFERDIHLCGQACVSILNRMAMLYNSKLKNLLEDLTENLPGSTFVYFDYYAITEDIINNYRSYGFENADHACCEVIGAHGGLIPCISSSRVCPDRSKYIFWDPFHPTDSAVVIGAKYALDGGLDYVSPINIRQLANS